MPLTNSQYSAVMREYDRRLNSETTQYENNLAEIYAQDENFAKIDESIASFSIETAKKLINGDANALYELRDFVDSKAKERTALLEKYGHSADDLKIKYKCSKCKDTGYVNNVKCSCFQKTVVDILYEQSNIKNILTKENFGAFSLDYYTEDVDPISGKTSLNLAQNALLKCKNFVDKFDKEFNNIILCGETGVGKTFLSNCIAKELLDSGNSVIYFTASELFNELANITFNRPSDEKEDAYSHILDADLLIIDDLGTELTNSFTVSQVFLVLNERILRQKSTIISTNLSFEEISERYSERVISRISENFTTVRLYSKDIRVVKKLKKHTV